MPSWEVRIPPESLGMEVDGAGTMALFRFAGPL